jgi:hypothetical protein
MKKMETVKTVNNSLLCMVNFMIGSGLLRFKSSQKRRPGHYSGRRKRRSCPSESHRYQQPTNQRPKPRPKRPNTNAPKKLLPGAVPTDGRLVGMLRQFIQKTNTDADVDRVLAQMKTHAGTSADLLQQACDSLTRVISVNYGTPYAQMAGRAFIGLHSKK